jgi:hypothetical protein
MRTPQPTFHDLEPGDRIRLKAGEYHRDDWLGPREFLITVSYTTVTNNFGSLIRSREDVTDGEGDTCDTWYLEDDWIMETEEGIEIAR